MTTRTMMALVGLTVGLWGFSVHAEKPAVSPEAEGIPSEAIEAWLGSLEKSGVAPRAFVIRRHGKLVACGNWKPASDNERRDVHGLTRLFVKTAAGIAIREGRIADDEKVEGLLAAMESDSPEGEAAADELSALIHRAVKMQVSTYVHERLFLKLDGACYDWSCAPAATHCEACGFDGWKVRPTQLSKIAQIYRNGGEFLGNRYFTEDWARRHPLRVMAYDGQVLMAHGDWIVLVLTDSTDHRTVRQSIRPLVESFVDHPLPERGVKRDGDVTYDVRHAEDAIRTGATDWSVAHTNLLQANCAPAVTPAPVSRIVWPKPAPGPSFGDSHVILTRNPDKKTGIARNSEGDLIKLKDGSLMLGWTQMTGGWGADFGDGRLMKCISRDGGRTWGEDEVLLEPPEGAFSLMEVSFLRLQSGGIGLLYGVQYVVKNRVTLQLHYRHSEDEGRTWSEAVVLQRPEDRDYNWGTMHQRLVQLKCGRLVYPSTRNRHVCVFYSDDEGRTWNLSAQTPSLDENGDSNACEEAGVVELKDGRLLYYFRTYRDYQYFSYSSDRGETWSAPKRSKMCSPGAPATITRLSDGRLYAVWANLADHPEAFFEAPSCNGVRSPLVLGVSEDEGETWRTLITLETRGHCAYSFVREYDGQIYLGYGYPSLMSLRLVKFPMSEVRGR